MIIGTPQISYYCVNSQHDRCDRHHVMEVQPVKINMKTLDVRKDGEKDEIYYLCKCQCHANR